MLDVLLKIAAMVVYILLFFLFMLFFAFLVVLIYGPVYEVLSK